MMQSQYGDNAYDTDFYAWTQEQAALLKARRVSELDWEHLAEEVESMGKSERRSLASRLERLIMHLLKWEFQPMYRSSSWKGTINEQRQRLQMLLEENPSLRRECQSVIDKIYHFAVYGATKETGLNESAFPEQCSYTIEQIIDDQNFFPGQSQD